MNYLAHAFLSNNNTDLLIGNFIADHVRGNNFSGLSPEIIEGIHLHRRIDSFTDTHAEFKKSKRCFYDGFERHSGILVDIYFDHLLARNFEAYSSVPLQEFSSKVYEVYTVYKHLFPAGSSRFLDYVIKNNIYVSYASMKGIETVLYHLSGRIKHDIRLDQSLTLFKQHEHELEQSFSIFFKDLLNSLATH